MRPSVQASCEGPRNKGTGGRFKNCEVGWRVGLIRVTRKVDAAGAVIERIPGQTLRLALSLHLIHFANSSHFTNPSAIEMS